jgi:hypothetical protein
MYRTPALLCVPWLVAELCLLASYGIAQVCRGPLICNERLSGDIGSPQVTANDQEYIILVPGRGYVSNVRGVVLPEDVHSPDVNSLGEIVYVQNVRNNAGENVQQIFSTVRGQLTFVTDTRGATQPSINDAGEVVYRSVDSQGSGQIFSTVRGQLTFIHQFGAGEPLFPAIDNAGRTVFAMGAPNDPSNCQPISCPAGSSENIWEVDTNGNLHQLTFFVFPEGATQPTLAAGTGELVYVHTDATSDGVVSLISDRDGVLFPSPPVPGTNFGVYPDLSPNGRLVFLGVEHADGTGPFHAWVGIRDNNGQECTYTGFTCNDTTPPVLTITATPETLWPPNGKLDVCFVNPVPVYFS